jgi:hypothetical protein
VYFSWRIVYCNVAYSTLYCVKYTYSSLQHQSSVVYENDHRNTTRTPRPVHNCWPWSTLMWKCSWPVTILFPEAFIYYKTDLNFGRRLAEMRRVICCHVRVKFVGNTYIHGDGEEGNVVMNREQAGCEKIDWFHPVVARNHGRNVVNTIMNHGSPWNLGVNSLS